MPPHHSSQFVLGVEAEEGVEGNLNYFGGGPECKNPTSWELPPLRREPHVAGEGARPRPRVLIHPKTGESCTYPRSTRAVVWFSRASRQTGLSPTNRRGRRCRTMDDQFARLQPVTVDRPVGQVVSRAGRVAPRRSSSDAHSRWLDPLRSNELDRLLRCLVAVRHEIRQPALKHNE